MVDPDEHHANYGDNRLLMTPTLFYPDVLLCKIRLVLVLYRRKRALDEQRLQEHAGSRHPGRLLLPGTFVVGWSETCPGAKVPGRLEDLHIGARFGQYESGGEFLYARHAGDEIDKTEVMSHADKELYLCPGDRFVKVIHVDFGSRHLEFLIGWNIASLDGFKDLFSLAFGSPVDKPFVESFVDDVRGKDVAYDVLCGFCRIARLQFRRSRRSCSFGCGSSQTPSCTRA